MYLLIKESFICVKKQILNYGIQYKLNLSFIPNILRHVFRSINFAPILFSMYKRCTCEIVLEGNLKKESINAARLLAMAPSIMKVIICM